MTSPPPDAPPPPNAVPGSAPAGAARVERAMWAHVVPFLVWIFLLPLLNDPWNYPTRTFLCLGLLFWLRPWRHYPAPGIRHWPLAFAVGAAVFAAWVFPESAWMERHAPAVSEFYERYLVGLWPFGQLRAPVTDVPYAPETAGWPLALIRLGGSAFVIAVIEEFFWRGFVYRWMQGREWLDLDPGKFDRHAFWITALVFGLEHNEWFAGLLAGAAFGWLYVRTRDLWAVVVAHAVANYLLGWYVLAAGDFRFW